MSVSLKSFPRAVATLRQEKAASIVSGEVARAGASKGTLGNAKCVKEILGGSKEVRRTKCTFLFQGKIGALNRLNRQINVLMFMSTVL